MALAPRAVTVHRSTELALLLARHGTRQQAGFFLQQRGRTLEEVEQRALSQQAALRVVAASIPAEWRRVVLERSDLDRFEFAPEDVVIAVGQDGLVANVAKYLTGHPVIGVDPEPGWNAGVLVRHRAEDVGPMLSAVVAGSTAVQQRVMVEARLDDGQVLRALNEVYIGHPSHQSARYRLTTSDGRSERQSSSGLLVGTGTGATGWCRSVWQERRSAVRMPGADEPRLCWFVREAWPSPATGTSCTEGDVDARSGITLTAESDLVVFGDGIESDRLELTWGQSVEVRVADQRLHLVG